MTVKENEKQLDYIFWAINRNNPAFIHSVANVLMLKLEHYKIQKLDDFLSYLRDDVGSLLPLEVYCDCSKLW